MAGRRQDLALATDDDNGNGYCSLIQPSGLAPGNYYVEVKKSSLAGATATFDYTLQIDLALSICGNGAKEPGESCDDGNQSPGDGCDASCQQEGEDPPTTGEPTTSDASDSDPSSSGDTTDAVDSADALDDEGCGCRSDHPQDLAPLALGLLILGLRRRRR